MIICRSEHYHWAGARKEKKYPTVKGKLHNLSTVTFPLPFSKIFEWNSNNSVFFAVIWWWAGYVCQITRFVSSIPVCVVQKPFIFGWIQTVKTWKFGWNHIFVGRNRSISSILLYGSSILDLNFLVWNLVGTIFNQYVLVLN